MATIDPVTKLSERQRACLRLVYAHLRQKEIARALGISPATVEMHLKAARNVLGAADSREAAQILAAAENGINGTYGQSIHGPQHIAEPLPDLSRIPLQPNFGSGQYGSVDDRSLREDQALFDAFSVAPAFTAFRPFPTAGRPRNDLGIWIRFAWIGTIIVGLLIGTAMMVGAMANLTPVIEALKH
jgi:DNA-binding CsgD family transcriptional regulator